MYHKVWNKDIVSVCPLNWYMQTFTQPACMKESYSKAALEMPVGKYQFMYWNVLVTLTLSLFRLSSWLWVPAIHMHRVTNFTLLWTFHPLLGVWRHDDLPQEKSCFLTTYLLWICVGALGRGNMCSDLEGLARFIMITFWPTEQGWDSPHILKQKIIIPVVLRWMRNYFIKKKNHCTNGHATDRCTWRFEHPTRGSIVHILEMLWPQTKKAEREGE